MSREEIKKDYLKVCEIIEGRDNLHVLNLSATILANMLKDEEDDIVIHALKTVHDKTTAIIEIYRKNPSEEGKTNKGET